MALPKLPSFRPGHRLTLADMRAIVDYLRAITPIVGGDVTPHPVAGGVMFNALGSGDGSSTPSNPYGDRCACPEEPYEISPQCLDCRGPAGTMPRIMWLEIEDAHDNSGSEAYCEAIACAELAGRRLKLVNVADAYGDPTCEWFGNARDCLKGELTTAGDYWQLTLIDEDGCVLAVLRKHRDDFVCCGTNTGWENDEESACTLTVTLEPDPCTCCPDVTCPPPGDAPLCQGVDCCFSPAANCFISVTVNNLATPPGLPCEAMDNDCVDGEGNPCNFGDPGCFKPGSLPPQEESCGGMSGVYNMNWAGDCTWSLAGVPAGPENPTEVEATLTLSGRTWTLRIEGEDGQVAVLRSSDWDCDFTVGLDFVPEESTCLELFPPPSAVFTLDLG